MSDLLGSEADRLVRAMDEPPVTAVRPNARKHAVIGCPAEPIPWNSIGYYISETAFGLDPLWHAGAYYVQEPSSQFVARAVERALKDIEGVPNVLDLCAAPGGKSTLIADTLPKGSLLVSNEVDPRRTRSLSENLAKWGAPSVVQTQNSAADFGELLPATFEIIAVDAPCSGEGMMRKSDEARAQWSPRLVEQCSGVQRSIIEDVWPALKPGGFLIYSTCTMNVLENEQNVQSFISCLGAEPIEIEGFTYLSSPFGPGYRLLPHKVRGEGFYLALLRKPGTLRANNCSPEISKAPLSVVTYSAPVLSAQGTHELDYRSALQYLHGDVLRLPASVPRGHICVAYQGLPLGVVNNIGSRANNLYPKEWRLRTTRWPDLPPSVVKIEH